MQIASLWKTSSYFQIKNVNLNSYLINFHNKANYSQNVRKRLGRVGRSFAIIRSWAPSTYIVEEVISRIPLWGQLHGIPTYLWGYEAIYHLGSTLEYLIIARICENNSSPSLMLYKPGL